MTDALRLTRQQRGQAIAATNRLFARERREFKSGSSDAVYVTMVMQDGRVTCNCRGWTIAKRRPRRCKHTVALIAARPTRTDGEFVYLLEGGTSCI